MKTIQQPATASEVSSSKTKQFFTALALAGVMVTAAGGGAAFMLYREFSAMPDGAKASHTARLSTNASQDDVPARLAPTTPLTSPVTADTTDRSDYRNVDNTVLPPAAARRVIAAWKSNPVVSFVPPPLVKTPAEETVESSNRPPLTDPESHYIVNAQSGRVLGVDGTASAQREQAAPAPVAVAVQMPPKEVRIASAVQVRAALPVNPDEVTDDTADPQLSGTSPDTSYVPVRRAQPVASNRSFDASAYLASQAERPVVRAGQVVNPTSRAAGFRQDFSLPDRSSR